MYPQYYIPSTFPSLATNTPPQPEEITPRPTVLLPSIADPASTQHTSPFNESHADQDRDSWIAYNPRCTPLLAAKTQGQVWSTAYRSVPCQIFRDSTTFQTPAPLHSPAQSHPIQRVRNDYPPQDTLAQGHPPANGPIVTFPSMPDHNLSTSHRMVRPTIYDPFLPANNSLHEANADSGRSSTLTLGTGSECPPGFGLGLEIDHGLIGRHLSGPVYTPRLTHDNHAFQDATLTATIEATASPQDSFAHVSPPPTTLLPFHTGPSLDSFTSKRKSTVLPVAHDPSLSPTGHHSHIPADDFFQPAMSFGASREHAGNDSQSVRTQHHENVGKAAHYLRHVNSRHWECNCGIPFSNRYNGSRHVREFVSCSLCHKKTGRKGNGTYCRYCMRALRLERERYVVVSRKKAVLKLADVF